jgi:hypothetical protein
MYIQGRCAAVVMLKNQVVLLPAMGVEALDHLLEESEVLDFMSFGLMYCNIHTGAVCSGLMFKKQGVALLPAMGVEALDHLL